MKVSLENDLSRFRHMQAAVEKAIELSSQLTREQLERDEVMVLALTRLLEITGEAGSKVTPERQQRFDTLPWAMLIGMRNHLAHGYFNVDIEIVWDTLQYNHRYQVKPVSPSNRTVFL
jgi:uncharacterized protein with HEPN domain